MSPLELSHRRFLEALRASPAMLFEQDLDLRYTAILNPQPPWTPDDVVGKTAFELLPADQAEALERVKRQVIATGQGAREVCKYTIGNREYDYLLTIEPNRDADGKIVGIICLAWDVTRERAIEQALQNSHAQLCSLVAEAPTSMALLDRDLRYIAASRTWVKEWGRGFTDLIGRSHYEIWPDAPSKWKTNHQAALSGQYMNKEEDHWVRPDGTKVWARWAMYPWRDAFGEIGGIVISIDDISERKRTEEALKESEERFRVMAETVPISLFITRADGYSEYVNDHFYKITGLTPGESRGNGWADSVHPDDRERIFQAWMTAVQTGEPYEERMRMINVETGKTRWYLSRAKPMRDAEGRIVRWFGCAMDIEDQVREAALREADRRKNEFLAMLSHELRNPLAAIRSAIYLIQHTPAGENAATGAQAVIDRQVTHLTRIVDDLLDIARITRGKFQLERRPLEFGEVVRRAVEDHRTDFEKRGIELECWLGSKELWVTGDETRLVQVIDNLLSNAAKFTRQGGHVEVFLKNDKDEALLRVKDTGIGIPPEGLADLFEPFVQIESTLDRGNGGLGLGLALVKGIVEMHGGHVSAASRGRGEGAELTVRLPLTTPGVPISSVKQTPTLRRRRVLLIEDNIDMADLLRQLLLLMGQDVHVAGDGFAGIELAHEVCPDLVICDIGLPEMSGLEVARKMRADDTFNTTELVALSGYGLPEDRKKSAEAGFSKHLVKPVSMEDLEKLLSSEG